MQQLAAMADMCRSTKIIIHYNNTCPKCGKKDHFQMEVPEFALDILTGGDTQNFCDDCLVEIERLNSLRREQQRREMLLEKAEIPADFLNWDRQLGNNQLARLIRENVSKNLIVCGKNATGKTRAAAINLKFQITEKGLQGRFVRWSDIAFGYARTCKLSSENSQEYIRGFLKNEILLIDDIGKRRITESAGEMLYDIVDLIYSGSVQTRLWITSNKNLEGLANTFENLDLGDAVVSRIDRMIAAGDMAIIEA